MFDHIIGNLVDGVTSIPRSTKELFTPDVKRISFGLDDSEEQDRIDELTNIMFAVFSIFPNLRYVPALPSIGKTLLIVMNEDEKAFWTFVSLI